MNDQAKRVLLVEDEVFVAMSLAMELRAAGYAVAKTCASGEAAVAYLRTNPVDVVLMDIGLAGEMDGVAAAGQIRTFSTVAIVFMSGYVDKENEPAVVDIQALGFLVKPLAFSRLQALLEALSQLHRSYSNQLPRVRLLSHRKPDGKYSSGPLLQLYRAFQL